MAGYPLRVREGGAGSPFRQAADIGIPADNGGDRAGERAAAAGVGGNFADLEVREASGARLLVLAGPTFLGGKPGPQCLDEGFGLINCPVRVHFHDVIAADFVGRHMRTQLPSIACTVVQRLDACFPPDAQCKFLREQNRAARAE